MQIKIKPKGKIAQIVDIANKLLDPIFNVSDTGLSSKTINNLNKKKLLWENFDDSKWRKFNFIEFIWLKIIQELTAFGFKKEIIEKMRIKLLEPIPNNVFYDIFTDKNLFEKFKEHGFTDEEIENSYKEIENKIEEDPDITLLFFVILEIIYRRENVSLLVDKDGEIFPLYKNSFDDLWEIEDVKDDYYSFINNDHFVLSITNKISDFVKLNFGIDLSKSNAICDNNIAVIHSDSIGIGKSAMNFCLPSELDIINKDEEEVLNLIRSKKLKELKIRFNENNEISLIEATNNDIPDLTAKLIDIILKDGYQDVSFTTDKGKIVKFYNTVKTKPK